MKLSPQEQSTRRAAFRQMSRREKLGYIAAYYKAPILLAAVLLAVLCSVVHRQVTKKEAVLYTAFVNVSVGESLESRLTEQFIDWCGEDARKKEVYLYRDLYLSDDASFVNHEYAYASRLKLLGAINANRLDVVLMNRESYDIFSRNGYLKELTGLLDAEPALRRSLTPYLAENAVVLSDNAIEYNLGEAASYQETVETVTNAIDVSDLPAFRDAGFSDSIYFGVVANSGHSGYVLRYMDYLLDS